MALPAGVSMMQALEQLNSTGRLAGKLTPEYFAANESWKVTNTVIALAVLEVLFIVLFFFSRIRIGTANGLDTYLMVPAFIVCFAHLILCWCEFQSCRPIQPAFPSFPAVEFPD